MDNQTRTPRRRRPLPPNVYPLQTFLRVERLMRKLGLTPADCLDLLADVLADLDRQVEEHEGKQDAPFPLWLVGEAPRPDPAA